MVTRDWVRGAIRIYIMGIGVPNIVVLLTSHEVCIEVEIFLCCFRLKVGMASFALIELMPLNCWELINSPESVYAFLDVDGFIGISNS